MEEEGARWSHRSSKPRKGGLAYLGLPYFKGFCMLRLRQIGPWQRRVCTGLCTENRRASRLSRFFWPLPPSPRRARNGAGAGRFAWAAPPGCRLSLRRSSRGLSSWTTTWGRGEFSNRPSCGGVSARAFPRKTNFRVRRSAWSASCPARDRSVAWPVRGSALCAASSRDIRRRLRPSSGNG
jgi:hypothetical protein